MNKILIISHNSFSDKRNNGKTLEALFSEFSKESIAQLYFHIGDKPDFDFCKQYYRITDTDLIKSVFREGGGIGNIMEEHNFPPSNSNYIKPTHKIMYNLYSLLGDWGRDLLWYIGKWKSRRLTNWIESFSPNAIFFVGGKTKFSANVALQLSKELEIPLLSYYTDDYLFSISRSSLKGKIQYKRILKIIGSVIHNSAAQYAIGDYMALEYSEFFHKPFKPIMNSVTIRPYVSLPKRKEITISYFGGLHLNRWQMIIQLAKVVNCMARIDVYTSSNALNDNIKSCFDSNGVVYRGSLSGEALYEAMIKSDILLHVESDDINNRRFTRLAISTKIPEYLITGRPILGYGPIEVASMKILSENNIGYVLSSDSPFEKRIKEMEVFLKNEQIRSEIGKRGYDYAVTHFDRKRTSRQLLSDINKIINERI